ncbi:MAG: hypothetical protein JAZ03_06200 [Candidatus Thiodiazotropha taylori]|nr:hypothetical protein [Candidatus Thiodiazotropha taylori]MCG8031749.1 hypothetical protein [Candidatus Thiodiazotropha taylori]MCW4260657.1 hypothetical protein [Candidatus Thiodiazotropha endolucinida]MCW4333512.1 hypothetical protein [Candidatus Thiodiazotropha endolucinida]
MERYLYVRSDESNDYFSDNKAYRFKVHLSLPLFLNGNWKVALTEFCAVIDSKSRPKTVDALYIYSDLCKESIVHGIEQPLLRRLNKNTSKSWDYMLETPYYLPVKKKEVREFEIYIKSGDGTFVSDLKEPLQLTLHLKQYPFL